jgi:ABC-type branched-subunit amino acid transport system ATPase component
VSGDIIGIDNVGHSFGGLAVLRDVSFAVPEGSVIGLIGPNGSGKSTLFNIITGFLFPVAGQVSYRGRDIAKFSVQQRSRAGLVRTFQTPKMFEHLSVLENVMAGAIKLTGSGILANAFALPSARADMRRMHDMASDVCEKFALDGVRDMPAARLTAGQRRLVELARAYIGKPLVLLLDEPSAGLNTEEVAQLESRLRTLNGEGITIFLVSHDMQLMAVADWVHVLYFGEIIASGLMVDLQRNSKVREVYLGL